MSYSVYFDYDNTTYRLPVNPEQIETTSVQAIEKYEILKLGQIAIPTHMELKEYSFECEFPHFPLHYVNTPGEFKNADYYLKAFKRMREGKKSIRFIASNGIGEDINTLVLIEELSIIEKAGEEGDKYVSFKLLQYKEYGKILKVVEQKKISNNAIQIASTKPVAIERANPKSNGYHIVVSGDTLWAIAKKYYGDGNKYTKIANANKDKIKNANLIYPGQKLVIP